MKKILCLIVGLAFIVGTAATTVAGELDIYGQYWGVVSAVNNGASFRPQPFNEDQDGDDWHAYQRMRQYFEYIASDNLKAVAGYEIDTLWGDEDSSGDLNADEKGIIEVKRAMLEYTTDQGTTLNIGVQGFGLPGGATGNPVLGGDMSGITANVPVNDMMSLTAGWIRLNEDAQPGTSGNGDSDAFLAVLPVQMEGVSASPYAVYARLGEDYIDGQPYHSSDQLLGTLGGQYAPFDVNADDSANAYWIGVPVSVTMMDPLVFEGQVIYGSVTGADVEQAGTDDDALDRSGFYVDASAAMNMEWGTPTVFGLYSTGDDDDFEDGSETFPTLFSDGFVSPPFATAFGFNGCCSNLSFGADYSFAQYTPNGIWEIGAGVKGLSFQDNLSHDIGVTYTRGTNDADVAKDLLADPAIYSPTATHTVLLTKDDAAWQFRFYNQYDINENLYLALDLGAAMMDMDSDTWDHPNRDGDDFMDDPITYSSAAIAYSF
jgi:hypothetical protein